jgi:GxxExxY protein
MIVKSLTENDPRTYAIIGAAMEVHKQLGCGFLEPVYQEALTVEFSKREIPFRREVTLPIFYKHVRLNTPYRVDFICFEEVAVELKALAQLSGTEEAQLQLSQGKWSSDRLITELWKAFIGISSLHTF